MTTRETITKDQLKALRSEAAQAGDRRLVSFCDRAIAGDTAAIGVCVDVIRANEAQS